MATDDDTHSTGDRVFHVELFIVHPTMAPAEITKALGIDPAITHAVGEQRTTPKGTLLPGRYPDTRWRHCMEYTPRDQWFGDKIDILLERLEPHKPFLRDVSVTGGSACLIVQFLGGYFGDELPLPTLAKLVDLGLSLGIEVYDVPQS